MENGIFGRVAEEGISLFHASGEAVTRLPGVPAIYPVDSDLSVEHEHPSGIVLRPIDAEELGIEIEG